MPFALNLLPPRSSPSRSQGPLDDYDGNSSCSSSTESNETIRSSRGPTAALTARPRSSMQRTSSTQITSTTAQGPPEFLLPQSANPSPVPSRSPSPLPIHYISPGASSSSYTSDADSEPTSPLLGLANSRRRSWWNDDAHRWWLMGSRPNSRRRRQRLRRETRFNFRSLKRQVRRLIRHPFFPKQPTSIVSVLGLSMHACSLFTDSHPPCFHCCCHTHYSPLNAHIKP